jgi:hypothetical protein
MKIFRSKFLKVNIPILKRIDDTFVRIAYFGGATFALAQKQERIIIN